MYRAVVFLLGVSGMVWTADLPLHSAAATVEAPFPEAIGILRGIENTRRGSELFRMRGKLKRALRSSVRTREFVVESEGKRYRVLSGNAKRSVAIFDAEKLLSYDGMDSAVITTRDHRIAATLAFDPLALGITTGLYSDHPLRKSIAYHSGKDITLKRPERDPGEPEAVIIELTDQFGQRIRFVVQPHSPFRVYRYSKTIPKADGHGIFTRYVTESEFWPDDPDAWLPRRLVMYTQPGGDFSKRWSDVVVEFEKPAFVSGFDPEIWTAKGLSMPVGQPLADLRIKQRIGYWNGSNLVESVPVWQPQPEPH